MKVYHITPIDDIEEHKLEITAGGHCICKCRPKESWVENMLIITHHSFDGREGLEEALDVLNNH